MTVPVSTLRSNALTLFLISPAEMMIPFYRTMLLDGASLAAAVLEPQARDDSRPAQGHADVLGRIRLRRNSAATRGH